MEVCGKVPKADAYYFDKPCNTLFYLIQKPDNASPDYCSELIYLKNLTTGLTKELFTSRNHREDRIPPKITADGENIFVRSHKDFLVYYNVKENILRRKGVYFDIEHMQAIGNRVLVVGEKKFEVYKVKQRFEDVANYRIDSPCHLHDGVFVFSRDSYLGVTSMENDNLRFKQTNVSVSSDVKITRKSNHVFELEQKGRKEDYLLEYSDGKPTLTLLNSNAVNKKPESSKARFLHRIWQGVVIRFWVFLVGLAIKELFEVVNVPLPAAF
uniref:DUF295 domain-containing protein n=1 Tax=Bursaphelenchus xylophilus TaxID=6326 RepID=A0A1I7SIP8_BURXY